MFEMAGLRARGAQNYQERFVKIYLQTIDEAMQNNRRREAV